MLRFAKPAKKCLALSLSVFVATAPFYSFGDRSRNFQKKERSSEAPRDLLDFKQIGKEKAARVTSYVALIAGVPGTVLEKYNRKNALLERVVSWDDKVVIEIDRNADGFVDEWAAFSEKGKLRMSRPRRGTFAAMDAELFHKGQQTKMHFTRDSSGEMRLRSKQSAPLKILWQSEVIKATGSDAKNNSADFAQSLGLDPLNNMIDNTNNAAVTKDKVKEQVHKLIANQDDCQNGAFKKKSGGKTQLELIKESMVRVLGKSDNGTGATPAKKELRYLSCMRHYGMDIEADYIQSRFSGFFIESKKAKVPQCQVRCQSCPSQGGDTTSEAVCSSQEKAEGAFNPQAKQNDCDVPPIYFVKYDEKAEQSQTAQSGETTVTTPPATKKHIKKGAEETVEAYAKTFFHEVLHSALPADGESHLTIDDIMNCCAPDEPGKRNCTNLSLAAGAAGIDLTEEQQKAVHKMCEHQGSKDLKDCESKVKKAIAAEVAESCEKNPTSCHHSTVLQEAQTRALTEYAEENCNKNSSCQTAATEAVKVLNQDTKSLQAALPTITQESSTPVTMPTQTAGGGAPAGGVTTPAGGGQTTTTPPAGAGAPKDPAGGATQAGGAQPAKPEPGSKTLDNTQGAAYRADSRGPAMRRAIDNLEVRSQVAAGFAQAFQGLNANPTTQQAVAATKKDESPQVKQAATSSEQQASAKDKNASQAQIVGQAPSSEINRGPASKAEASEKNKAGESNQPAKPAAAAQAEKPQSLAVVAAKADGKGGALNLSAAAQAVRGKAKKNDPAARRYFVTQMTKLSRDEMRLALADGEVKNSLRDYVIGAIDDRKKRRDEAENPRDWLIYSDKKQRLVFKQLGLAKR